MALSDNMEKFNELQKLKKLKKKLNEDFQSVPEGTCAMTLLSGEDISTLISLCEKRIFAIEKIYGFRDADSKDVID